MQPNGTVRNQDYPLAVAGQEYGLNVQEHKDDIPAQTLEQGTRRSFQ